MANVVSGVKYKALADAANGIWNKISFWKKAEDVELEDGTNAELRMNQLVQKTTGLDDEVTAFETNYPQWEDAVLQDMSDKYQNTYTYESTISLFKVLANVSVNNQDINYAKYNSDYFNCLIPLSVDIDNMEINETVNVNGNTAFLPVKISLTVDFSGVYNTGGSNWEKDSATITDNRWTIKRTSNGYTISVSGQYKTPSEINYRTYRSTITVNTDTGIVSFSGSGASNSTPSKTVNCRVIDYKIQVTAQSEDPIYPTIADIQNEGLYNILNQVVWNKMYNSTQQVASQSWYGNTNYIIPTVLNPVPTGDTSVWEWQEAMDLSDAGGYSNGTITLALFGNMGDSIACIKYKDNMYVWDFSPENTTNENISSSIDTSYSDSSDTENNNTVLISSEKVIQTTLDAVTGSSTVLSLPCPLLILTNLPTGEEGESIYVSEFGFSSLYMFVIEQHIESSDNEGV